MAERPAISEIELLRAEIDSLRLANAAIQQQMSADAAGADALLRAMEAQANALREAHVRQRAQADFTQRVMDTSGALMIVLDAEGRIRQVNRRFLDELESPSGALVGRAIDEWLAPEDFAALSAEVGQLPWPVYSPLFERLRRDSAYEAEHRLRAVGGEYRTFWVEARAQTDPQGKEEGAVVCATDITPLKQQSDALLLRERQLREAQRIAQLGNWEIDLASGAVLHWSDELRSICEQDERPRDRAALLAMVHPEDRAATAREFDEAAAQGGLFALSFRLDLPAQRTKWLELRGLVSAAGQAAGTLQDITAQRQADEQISLDAKVFESSLNAVIITDARTRILRVNRAFTRILGYEPEEVIGLPTSRMKSGRHDRAFYSELWASLQRDGQWQGEIWDRRKDGECVPLWQSISLVRDARGQIVNYIAACFDLSDQKRAAAHIHHLAYYDALTDLPNRLSLNEACDQALKQARRDRGKLALLFLDLDRFKNVNDTLGHRVGDELLCKVARRLKRILRESDMVARLGGDEFVVLTQGINGPGDAARVAEKILATLARSCVIEGHRLEVRASIGISCYPGDGSDAATLIKHADLALYKAKEEGRDQFRFYEEHLATKARERLFLETELREAIKNGDLALHYQPQFRLSDGQLVASEALARWRHAARGWIPPAKFIAIAEECGLIVQLGEWALREACRQGEAWRRAGLGPHRIAVNVSGIQLEHADFVGTVARILAETGLPPAWLEIEVTETYVMRQPEKNVRVLQGLRDLGVELAIDDFGSGQSSLAYLKRLPVQTLKIDRAFITDLPFGENETAIARAIVVLGHSLNLHVLAEGIETPAQADFLRGLGCDLGQGYFYSQPVPAERMEQILRQISKAPGQIAGPPKQASRA